MKKLSLLLLLNIIILGVYAQDCKWAKNETDDFTGQTIKVLQRTPFVQHTDEELKKYYRKKHYTTCNIACAEIEGVSAVYMDWILLTEKAYKYYGAVRQNAEIILKLENGETVTLVYGNTETGETNYTLKMTSYYSYCVLSDEQIKALKSSPIEKVRQYWSKGYKDYEVSHKTAFMEQLKCFE